MTGTRRSRANGEGSIFPYKNGYAAYVWVTTPAGARKRKYVYGPTRETVTQNGSHYRPGQRKPRYRPQRRPSKRFCCHGWLTSFGRTVNLPHSTSTRH